MLYTESFLSSLLGYVKVPFWEYSEMPFVIYGQGYAEYHSETVGKMAAAERTKRKGGTVNGR